MRLCTGAALLFLSTSTFACSGSHVQETIASANFLAKSFVVLLVLEGLSCWLMLKRAGRGVGHPVLFLLLLLVNPGVWDRGTSGDCGTGMVTGSFLICAFGGGLTITQLIYYGRSLDNGGK